MGWAWLTPTPTNSSRRACSALSLWAIGLLNVWVNYALCAKRLHDRNRSGWWLLAPTVTLLVAILLAFVMFAQPEGQREPWNSAAVFFTLATVALGIWLFLEIGFLRGTEGPNSYGPDPLSQKQGDTTL